MRASRLSDGDGLATTGQGERDRQACRGKVGQQDSLLWQAMRHARRVGGSYPMAGEEWREGELVPPISHGQTKYKLSWT